ncbi:glycosyltransferase [Nocardia sp. GAS34]|uniref:glycosyltransferase n=1 Tax=unclassified Nocardia TaxID=2637762 RepID=UPI003D2532AD
MTARPPHGISFIVPCFNSGSYLLGAVDSLIAQPLSIQFEIIVVDDGSDDPATQSPTSGP